MMRTFSLGAASLAAAVLAASAGAQVVFHEDFDSYAPGSGIAGQGGWEIWCSGGSNAFVSSSQARSQPNSLRVTPAGDVIQRFNADQGQWVFTVWVYVPSSASGSGYVNLMNQYCIFGSSGFNWSTATEFSASSGLVMTWLSAGVVNLVYDQWAEYRVEIDLDANLFSEFYNGQTLLQNESWTDFLIAAEDAVAALQLDAVNLYSQDINEIFFDDVTLEMAGAGDCYPDCDGNGEVNLFDFFCFVSSFNAGDPYADCDDNDAINLFDFFCFVGAFNEGCG